MALEFEERNRIQDLFDVYDLVELLGLSAEDIIEAFEERIEVNKDILEKIGGSYI